MRLSIRSTPTLTTDHGEVELEFNPYTEDDIIVHRVGNKLVVGYLVHDESPSNPMTDCDCQGHLYTAETRRRGVITDNDRELRSALGLNSYGEIDHDNIVTINGVRASIWDHAAGVVEGKLDVEQWADLLRSVDRFDASVELTPEQKLQLEQADVDAGLVASLRTKHAEALRADLCDSVGYHADLVEAEVRRLYQEHWREIAGPFVVPMNYSDYGYETNISPVEWDGDPDDLPNALWVADKGAQENIEGSAHPDNVEIKQIAPFPDSVFELVEDGKVVLCGTYSECWKMLRERHPVTDETLRQTARRYAEAVCDEYAKWCSGDVYGCVLQIFSLKGDEDDETVWVAHGDWDSCWGFIGHENAMENLGSEFVDPVVSRLQKALIEGEPHSTGDLTLVHPLDSEGGLTD